MTYFIIRWTSPTPSPSDPKKVSYSSRIVTADDQESANDLGARYVASIRDGDGHRLTSVNHHPAGAT